MILLLLYGLCTGQFISGNAERSYLAFEQGHARAFAKSYNPKTALVDAQSDVHRLFGTPEENHYSVLTAIRHNPAAILKRIPPLTKQAIKDTTAVYGWYFGLFCFAFSARGLIELIKKKSAFLLATLLLWPAYCILYLLFCSQPSHFLIPFLTVFSLASAGVSAFSLNLDSWKERYLWTAAFLPLGVVAVAKWTVPNDPLAATFAMLLGLWGIWLVMDHYRGIQNPSAIACLLLLSVGLVVRFGIPSSEERRLGRGPDEQALVYLSTHFGRGTRIGAWGPGRIWSARMEPVTMEGDLRYIKSGGDVLEWMTREGVEAIYADNYLRTYQPSIWDTIQKEVGKGLAIAFEGDEGIVQILVRTPR